MISLYIRYLGKYDGCAGAFDQGHHKAPCDTLITDLSTSPFLSTNCLPEMPPIVDHPRNETLIIRDIIDGVAVLQ